MAGQTQEPGVANASRNVMLVPNFMGYFLLSVYETSYCCTTKKNLLIGSEISQ